MLHGKWVIIDEVSLLPIDTLGQIARWQMVGAKFVLFGDFEGQFEAFIDRWKEVSYADVPQSQLLMDMCTRTHFHMEVYRRGDDQVLYDWYTRLYTEPDRDIARLVSDTRRRYPLRITPMEAHTILCISHAKRMIINARQNTAFAAVHEANGLHTRHIEWKGEAIKGTTCQPQSMTIWEGIHLIGCPRGSGKAKLGVVQGVMYNVEHIAEDTVTLKMLPEYRSSENAPADATETAGNTAGETADAAVDKDVSIAKEEVTVPLDDVTHVLRLSHAMCFYTVQGRTFRDHTVLIDTSHTHVSRRALIVGLSRATNGRLVHVAT